MNNEKFVVASSPHIHSPLNTQKIMGMVIAALIPAGLAGVYFFGLRVIAVIITCVASCVLAEYAWQRGMKREPTVCDLSAAVTGLLLAYNLPPSIPLWMAACGSVFAIIVVKQFFGGLGGNIVNPALAGRAMMLISWPVAMTTWTLHGVSGATVSGMSSATPLALMKIEKARRIAAWSYFDLYMGDMGGCIGETSTFLLLLGGVFLIYNEIISWRIPVTYILTTAILAGIFGHGGGFMPIYEILSGGLILGAIFMATDYTTSPVTPKGQFIFAFGCGLLTALIRTFGGYPEGVSYSILIMNIAVPLIDKYTAPRVLGAPVKGAGK